MKKYILIIIVTFLSCEINEKSDDKIQFNEHDYSEAYQLIEYWLEAQKDYEKLPGLTAIITDKNETRWAGSYGLSDGVNPMNIESTFSICSISKLLCVDLICIILYYSPFISCVCTALCLLCE